MTQSAQDFLENKEKGLKINKEKKNIYISKIFKWFKEDFNHVLGVTKFIEDITNENISSFKINYLDYNWNLNTTN